MKNLTPEEQAVWRKWFHSSQPPSSEWVRELQSKWVDAQSMRIRIGAILDDALSDLQRVQDDALSDLQQAVLKEFMK